MERIEQDIRVWLEYFRATESLVRDYLQRYRVRIRIFLNARNGHIFMLEALQEDPQIAFQEFRMYPPLFINFTHLLRDAFGLSSEPNVDIYEQLLDLGARIIRPKPNYNESPAGHRPCPNKHPHFQGEKATNSKCAGQYVTLISASHSSSLGRLEMHTIAEFWLGTIHNLDINFPLPANGKYYLVDSGFAHMTGYMALYKGANIRYHFQDFRSNTSHGRRSSGMCRWTILDCMPRYPFRKQTAVFVAAITVHNFIRRASQRDNAFRTMMEVEEAAEIDFPDEIEHRRLITMRHKS
ncbi:Uncharacterized protein Adt_35162 [Abeliophyllum distichum]|uniref:DDE Tnp4 domain-containing protein n=1 Tax=Abeliophyllum distichum TaxID=126358 RepID=A0ABD1QDX9_9LAMI